MAAKMIQNPEVPGLECFLPPPPPPPPPPIISNNSNDIAPPGTTPTPEPVPPPAIAPTPMAMTMAPTHPMPPTPFPNVAAPYYAYPAMQPPGQPATPWWIPTEADGSDAYAQWYEATYKGGSGITPVPPPMGTGGKSKNKPFKRKSEAIDPAQDAEKVASAQRELSALMKPLNCDLCNAVMNSTLQAKLHYDGKPHQKKVSMFLNQSVKKLKSEDGQVSSTTSNDWNTYCDICKTWFTSQTDASQHYAGKKHTRAANGGPRPKTSKKSQNQAQMAPVDPTGRFGIGSGFKPDVPASPVVSPVPDGTASMATAPTPVYTPAPYPVPLRCDLCGVSANRPDQLETHKRGARHLRMLRLNGLPLPEAASETESVPQSTGPIDYSIYRTPSGQYYCAPCNLSLNSETSFAQHVDSKKHKNQLNPKSTTSATVLSKKAKFKKK